MEPRVKTALGSPESWAVHRLRELGRCCSYCRRCQRYWRRGFTPQLHSRYAFREAINCRGLTSKRDVSHLTALMTVLTRWPPALKRRCTPSAPFAETCRSAGRTRPETCRRHTGTSRHAAATLGYKTRTPVACSPVAAHKHIGKPHTQTHKESHSIPHQSAGGRSSSYEVTAPVNFVQERGAPQL